ncbi:sphingomyelin phosphodiesterase [Anaeramoeba flamelloides]|uniref:Sphingomyelin phosphodiesterase n=1 Tax=Anaeramoeba flamelloides TaxID=1746091 RepID=A0ABQ8ZAQ4_9EUKA|nr:sphingomyelin phosphodiesterase [Anaeramoeba flamelloides]
MKNLLIISVIFLIFYSASSKQYGKFLVINDAHLDKNYKEGGTVQCDSPCACCCDDMPPSNYTGQTAGKWGSSKCNTPFRLFEQVIPVVQQQQIDFVVFLGDAPSMAFWEVTYEDSISYVKYVAQQLAKLVDIPVVPVIGNHDYSPSDFFTCDGSMDNYYKTMADIYKQWLPSDIASFHHCGWYSNSIIPGLRFLIMNTMICDPADILILHESEEMTEQCKWLDSEIQKAKDNGEKVYLFGHVPIGQSTQRIYPPLCWTNSSLKIAQLMEKYPDTIVSMFSGHTHFSEFRVVYDTKTSKIPVGMNLISPSFVPEASRYSGFRIYDYNTQSFEITNIHQWYSNPYSVGDDQIPVWEKHFDFLSDYKDYGVEKVNPSELDKIAKQITTNEDLFKLYYQRYAPRWNVDSVTEAKKNLIKCSLPVTKNSIYTECLNKLNSEK